MADPQVFLSNKQLMRLSKRESEVLYLIAQEFSNKEMSKMLFLSVNTIDTYRRKLFLKFGVRNAPGLIRKAYEEKVLPMKRPDF